MRTRDVGGATLIEAVCAMAIVALAFLPVLQMTASSTHESAFTEFHSFMQLRASRILAKFAARDYGALRKETGSGGALAFSLAEPGELAEYDRMLTCFEERCEFSEVADGLGRLTATVSWSFPTDGKTAGGRRHEVRLSCLVSDPVMSWRKREGLTL